MFPGGREVLKSQKPLFLFASMTPDSMHLCDWEMVGVLTFSQSLTTAKVGASVHDWTPRTKLPGSCQKGERFTVSKTYKELTLRTCKELLQTSQKVDVSVEKEMKKGCERSLQLKANESLKKCLGSFSLVFFFLNFI